jgi:8-oxo-dGTP diphosphatase
LKLADQLGHGRDKGSDKAVFDGVSPISFLNSLKIFFMSVSTGFKFWKSTLPADRLPGQLTVLFRVEGFHILIATALFPRGKKFLENRPMSLLTVAAAALIDEGRVLLQQRPAGFSMPGLWEFPGGKLENGETPEAALVRELKEELGVDALQKDLEPIAFASAELQHGHLLLLLYTLSKWSGELRPLHASGLRWLRPAEMISLPMPPADRPLVRLLERLL